MAIDNSNFPAESFGALVQVAEQEKEKKAPFKTRKMNEERASYYTKTKFGGNQTGELDNIAKGISPFSGADSGVSVRDAIELMQKAYYNISVVRGAIDVLCDLANSKIKFKGKNKAAVKFFTAWEKSIGGWNFRSKFFKEFWRSCNVFVYKHFGEISYKDLRKMSRTDVKGAELETKKIPIRYSILNPADIRANDGSSFVDCSYSKILNKYETKRLQSPAITDEEQTFVNSLTEQQRKNLKAGQTVEFQINPQNLVAVFNGRQDYESLATPCFYPVLQDINFKIELRKQEMILARASDKYLLLINCGDENRSPEQNSALINAMMQAFSQDSVGRVMAVDHTVKAQFVIPDLNKVFGEGKYKSINEDIANGLMNIFWKDEAFSSSMIKIQIFLERLKTARETYIDMFLRPEMEKIAQSLGYQDAGDIQIEWEDFNLKDDLEYKKLYTRLVELGILTPDETFTAFKTHQLPLKDESVEDQREYKKYRDEDLYEPLMGNKTTDRGGRPSGSKAPQTTKKVSPVGASEEGLPDKQFSLSKVQENLSLVNSISMLIEAAYKEKNGLSRLSKKHKKTCWDVTSAIVSNEDKDDWEAKIPEYMAEFKNYGPKTDESFYLAAQHNIDPVIGAILNYSRIPEE